MRKSQLRARAMSAATRQAVADSYAAGKSLSEISSEHGIAVATAKRWTLAHGGKLRSPAGKLSGDEIACLCERYCAGETSGALALAYGIARTSVWRLVSYRGISRSAAETSYRRYPLRTDAFDELTPDACYWLGFLITDGCLSLGGKRRYLNLWLAEQDEEQILAFRDFLGTTQPVQHHAAGNFVIGGRTIKSGRSVGISVFCSRYMVDRLIRLGITARKSHTAGACGALASSPDFWRGCIDGDGSIGVYRNYAELSLCGASERLLRQFRRFIRKHFPKCNASVRAGKGCLRITMSGPMATEMIRLLYERPGPGLARKRLRAKSITGQG
jgi:hypothetical protein